MTIYIYMQPLPNNNVIFNGNNKYLTKATFSGVFPPGNRPQLKSIQVLTSTTKVTLPGVFPPWNGLQNSHTGTSAMDRGHHFE